MSAEDKIIEEVYGVPYEELDEVQQDSIDRILDDMPDSLFDVIEGEHLTPQMVQDAMNETFEKMEDTDGFTEEHLNGAAIFAKGLEKRLGLRDSSDG